MEPWHFLIFSTNRAHLEFIELYAQKNKLRIYTLFFNNNQDECLSLIKELQPRKVLKDKEIDLPEVKNVSDLPQSISLENLKALLTSS